MEKREYVTLENTNNISYVTQDHMTESLFLSSAWVSGGNTRQPHENITSLFRFQEDESTPGCSTQRLFHDQTNVSQSVQNFTTSQNPTIENYILVVIAAIIGAFGGVTNVINILVFLKQGLRDCVNLCLLSLSLTDLSSVTLGLLVSVSSISHESRIVDYVDLDAVEFILAYPAAMFYDISSSTMALIAVQRCLCVALPFRFKNFMTIRRTLVAVVCIYMFNIGMYMPHYLSSKLLQHDDPRTNTTRVVLFLSDNRPEVDLFLNTFVHLTEAAICLAVVLVSTTVMVVALRRSSKFQKCGNRGQPKRTRNFDPSPSIPRDPDSDFETRISKVKRISGKNRNVAKTVLILATICFICNSLRFVVVVVLRVFPNIYYGRPQEYLFLIFLKVTSFSQTINCSVHIIVYYIFNSSFKRTINEFLNIS